jgi:hypothetical protein
LTLENAQQYVRLLVEVIADAKGEIEADLCEAAEARSERRVQALRIVQFKLEQHLQSSSRLLNDLRTLRRLLLDERLKPATASHDRDFEESGFPRNRSRPASEWVTRFRSRSLAHALNFSANFLSDFASFDEIVNMQFKAPDDRGG